MLNDYACIILDIFCTSVHFFNTYIKFTSNNKIFIHKDRVLILSIEDRYVFFSVNHFYAGISPPH